MNKTIVFLILLMVGFLSASVNTSLIPSNYTDDRGSHTLPAIGCNTYISQYLIFQYMATCSGVNGNISADTLKIVYGCRENASTRRIICPNGVITDLRVDNDGNTIRVIDRTTPDVRAAREKLEASLIVKNETQKSWLEEILNWIMGWFS